MDLVEFGLKSNEEQAIVIVETVVENSIAVKSVKDYFTSNSTKEILEDVVGGTQTIEDEREAFKNQEAALTFFYSFVVSLGRRSIPLAGNAVKGGVKGAQYSVAFETKLASELCPGKGY